MKILKFLLLAAAIIIIENLWPWKFQPDLFLLLIITYCVGHSSEKGVFFAFAAGFVEDILFSLYFLNTLVKTLAAVAIAIIKDKLILNFERLSYLLILIFSPLVVLAEGLLRFVFYREAIVFGALFMIVFTSTLLNLLFAPLFIYFIKKAGIYEGE